MMVNEVYDLWNVNKDIIKLLGDLFDKINDRQNLT